jgi:hsp70-interacting protein
LYKITSKIGCFVDLLTSQLDSDSDETCRVKALYAISCISRDSAPALAAFAALDGWSVLLRAIQVCVCVCKILADYFPSEQVSRIFF